MTTHDDVRRICSRLPGAVEGVDRFGFSVEVKGKFKGFLWTWAERIDPKKARVVNDSVLAIIVPGLAAKDAINQSDPDKYIIDPHYNGFPAVLVRLDAVDPEELEDLIVEAWRCKAPPALVKQYDTSTQ
ncbi:MmcQ/YjbR family DNA-binding protein [Fimbriimonas ginsengisoli]|uniref:MmcQ/YjbR family DNA-binding protein n=1 Tax=Fimbriimonas ginsengisoli Gsoil 348 TaxID=661478 RepID=A0A068NLQ1_FIMGI|nr:hypothetical protein [Fimbriimonas ginsengisoli]AIE83690.1 hypothetical protein OP10G_0322 [Fimbriimonas ginsengisoli Gsoil 348]